jgi:hypothetical protein
MSSPNYHQRVWRAFRERELTHAFLAVLLELPRFRGPDGICPAHAALAKAARCCPRTAQRALQAARALGLVSWRHRSVRVAWRALRTSNLYVLAGLTPATNGQFGRGKRIQKENTALEEAQAALAAVRKGAEARIAAFWRANRDVSPSG